MDVIALGAVLYLKSLQIGRKFGGVMLKNLFFQTFERHSGKLLGDTLGSDCKFLNDKNAFGKRLVFPLYLALMLRHILRRNSVNFVTSTVLLTFQAKKKYIFFIFKNIFTITIIYKLKINGDKNRFKVKKWREIGQWDYDSSYHCR